MSENESMNAVEDKSTSGLTRREILLGMGAAATAAYAGAAVSATSEHDHGKHDHSKHSAQLPDVLSATNECLDTGQRCIAHCLVTFKEGDLALADCASKVHEMAAVCDAFGYLLASNSSYLKAYATVCEQVCKDCETECMKHKEHIECKACGEACAALIDQIKLRLS